MWEGGWGPGLLQAEHVLLAFQPSIWSLEVDFSQAQSQTHLSGTKADWFQAE